MRIKRILPILLLALVCLVSAACAESLTPPRQHYAPCC